MKISLGCGWLYHGSKFQYPFWDAQRIEKENINKKKGNGYIGIDKKDYGQHYVRDIRRGLPFSDNSIDEILADSVLEHIPYGEHFGETDFAFIMNECLRVLKPQGKIIILVPNACSESFYKDPTHIRYFSKDSFKYLLKENAWDYGFNKGWIIQNQWQRKDILYFILGKEKNEIHKH